MSVQQKQYVYIKTIISYIGGLLLLFMIVLATSNFVQKDNNSKLSTINRVVNDSSIPPTDFSGISVYANISSVDIRGFLYRLHMDFRPKGAFADISDVLIPQLNGKILCTVDSRTLSFPDNEIMATKDIDTTIQTGNPNDYPFDTYESNFFFQCQQATDKVKLPLSISVVNSLEEWWIDMKLTDLSGNNFSIVGLKVVLSRAPTQKFFSLSIISLMWVISLGIFFLAISHFIFNKRVEAPTLGVVTSMLFALPAVRNMQPGAPPIGCTTDVIGFFWNVGLIAVASVLLLWRYSFQDTNSNSNPKPPPTKISAPDDIHIEIDYPQPVLEEKKEFIERDTFSNTPNGKPMIKKSVSMFSPTNRGSFRLPNFLNRTEENDPYNTENVLLIDKSENEKDKKQSESL
ncbi:hypothetical protein BC833DRAFT_610616 [Globomyces pollinis-pini]|nr:hypothetical protein BC833DRAFT_610616 [Globomyces pollinis-pini]